MSFIKYDSEGKQIRNRVTLDTSGDEIRVEQSHKDDVNINNIVKKHGIELIGKIAALQQFQYDDVTGNDFQESMNAILKAKETFQNVPSDIRKKFDNDPAKFMDFVHNNDNHDELVSMGLMNAPEEVQPVEVVVTNPVETPPVEPAP